MFVALRLRDYFNALGDFTPKVRALFDDFKTFKPLIQELRSEVNAECALNPELDPDERMLKRVEAWLTQLEQLKSKSDHGNDERLNRD